MTTPRKPAVADPRVDDDFTPLAKACSAMGTISKSMARASGEPGPPALVGLECGPNPCPGKREGDRSRPRKTSRNYSKRFVKIESIVRQIFRGLAPRAHSTAGSPSGSAATGQTQVPSTRSVFRAGAGASTHLTRHGQTQPPPRATHIDSSAPANPAITPLAASLLNSFF